MDARLSQKIRNLWEMFGTFWKLWLAFFVIAGLSLAVLTVQNAYPAPACTIGTSSYPWTQCWLGDSTRTPWGIVTAFFVHTSYEYHYLPNVLLLFAVVFVFCATNGLVPRDEKRFRQRVFLWSMFLAGIAGNVASLFLYGPYPSVGASGLDYAALGITLVFCVVNVFPRIQSRKELTPYYRNPLNLIWSTVNAFLAFVLIYLAVALPAAFLSVGPGVNVLVHFSSLIVAMGLSMVWFQLHYHKVGRRGAQHD